MLLVKKKPTKNWICDWKGKLGLGPVLNERKGEIKARQAWITTLEKDLHFNNFSPKHATINFPSNCHFMFDISIDKHSTVLLKHDYSFLIYIHVYIFDFDLKEDAYP